MNPSGAEPARVETIVAGLIYLLSHYAQNRCPRLAVCVARHLQCVSAHPEAPPVIRQVCASLAPPWIEAAQTGTRAGALH